MINDHGDDEDEDGDDDDDEGDDDDDDGVDDNDGNDVNYNAHVFGFYNLWTCLDLLNHTRVLVKFKKKFPPNDKAKPPPMLACNSYGYVSYSKFASDSTCIFLGV